MGAPSPFQVANAIGTNVAGAFRQVKDENAISRILQEASKTGNPQDVQNAIGKILSQVSPERQSMAINYLQNQYQIVQEKQKQERERKRQQMINLESGAPVDFDKWTPESRRNYFETQKPKKNEPLTQGQKVVQTEEAKQYIKDKNQIPLIQDSLNNLEEIKRLTHELSGPTGYFKAAIGSPDATKLEAMGLAALDNIIKIFNPSGNLATQKLNFIREKFSFTPWDRTPKILGKVQALEVFGKQALKRAQDRIQLYENYNMNPPTEVVKKFDADTETLADSMIEYSKEIENSSEQNLSETVMIIRPDLRRAIPVPRDQVEAALKAGGKLAQ